MIWGNQFLGLSPLHSLIFFVVFTLFLAYKHKTKWHRKPLWAIEIIEKQKRDESNKREKLRVMMGDFMSRRYRVHFINIVFPGLGYLYQNRSMTWGTTLLLLLTSLFYALYATLFFWSFSYPYWESFKLYLLLLAAPLCFNIFFVGRGFYDLYVDQNYKEALDGV